MDIDANGSPFTAKDGLRKRLDMRLKLAENKHSYFTHKRFTPIYWSPKGQKSLRQLYDSDSDEDNKLDEDYQLAQIFIRTDNPDPASPNYSDWDPDNPKWDFINVKWEDNIPIFPDNFTIEQDDDHDADEDDRIDEGDGMTTWWHIFRDIDPLVNIPRAPLVIIKCTEKAGGKYSMDVDFNFGRIKKRKK